MIYLKPRSSTSIHNPDIELRIIEQCQVNLPAHRGKIGLVEQQTGRPSKKSPRRSGAVQRSGVSVFQKITVLSKPSDPKPVEPIGEAPDPRVT